MLRSISIAILSAFLVGCSEQRWQDREYATVAATRGATSRAERPRQLLTVLDGLAQLLYSDGFFLETNGPDLRPKTVFSGGMSSFERHTREPFESQTSFVIIEKPTSTIYCVVVYDSQKQVWVTLGQRHVTSIANPKFPVSAGRKQQIDRLVDKIRLYLHARLPGYRLVGSPSQKA